LQRGAAWYTLAAAVFSAAIGAVSGAFGSKSSGAQESEENYLPSLFQRCCEFGAAFYDIHFPPDLELGPGDCVVVLDAIEAYRCMFDKASIEHTARLAKRARACGAKVIYTQWVRTRPTCEAEKDATDVKGHWSNYVSPSQIEIFPELKGLEDLVAPVRFTNAFTSEEVCSMVAAHKTKRVLLCGGWYEACILSTCHACLERDITVGVVKDCSVGHFPLSLYSSLSMQTVHAQFYQTPSSWGADAVSQSS
jgi:nicotinamidase-related amidase